MSHFKRVLVCHLLVLGALLAAACDDKSGSGDGDSDGAGGIDGGGGSDVDGGLTDGDGGQLGGDGGTGMCNGGTQCSDCLDNDQDGLVDGNDPECTGPLDRDESSFATGIPGDNIDPKVQDCFFDGNSGGGQDCKYHTCCILDLAQQPGGTCPDKFQPPNYDPAKCTTSQTCEDLCIPLTPPGCDCFGCCTVCDGPNCRDIVTNPAIAPDCTQETLGDPVKCPACVKSTECMGTDCDPANCILCPGQTPEDLPPTCTEQMCPGSTPCVTSADCSAGFCSVGCCKVIE